MRYRFFDSATPPSHVADGEYGNEAVNAWSKKIQEADAYIIISPEYNHGYSGVLKNALDSIYNEWGKKPVAFVSYGGVGGARAVEQLRQVVIELQMIPIRQAVHIQAPWNMLDESGLLKPGSLDAYTQPLEGTAKNLAWWAQSLKAAREKSV